MRRHYLLNAPRATRASVAAFVGAALVRRSADQQGKYFIPVVLRGSIKAGSGTPSRDDVTLFAPSVIMVVAVVIRSRRDVITLILPVTPVRPNMTTSRRGVTRLGHGLILSRVGGIADAPDGTRSWGDRVMFPED